MKKMIVTMVIEAQEEELKSIRGAMIAQAGEALVNLNVDILDEPKKEIQCFNIGRVKR